MPFEIDSTIIGITAGGLLLAYTLWRNPLSSPLPLPPSPKSYPLIGNLLSMPEKDEHLGFIKLGEQLHSDIISLSMFGNVVVVLNNAEDVINLFEKRSGIYADRPRFPVVTEPSLMDWGAAVSAMRYGERWKQSRRLIHRWLHKQAAEAFQPAQLRQARVLLQSLLKISNDLDSSEELEDELCRAISGTLMDSLYGCDNGDLGSGFANKAKKAMDVVGFAGLPSNFLANIFPALMYVPDWFPGTGWKRFAREGRVLVREAAEGPFNWTKAEMKKSLHEPSIVESMLGQAKDLGIGPDDAEENVKHIALMLFGGALDTSTNALLWFFIAMILYPEAQKKAQDEIDSVIVSERLPEMEDRDRLPYVGALIQELYRWRPVIPLAIPHACQQDDVYKGYRIPKEATVIGNIWAIGRDPKVYADPEKFNPDRFLDPAVPPVPVFGFGRRICPGMHYAESTLFIFVASLLVVFNIGVAQDKDGNDLVPAADGKNAIILHPVPFKLKLTPRSTLHEQLVLGQM